MSIENVVDQLFKSDMNCYLNLMNTVGDYEYL